jgi:hypothetical protein
MDSTTKELLDEALITLQKTGRRYTLLIDDTDGGIAFFTNGQNDRLTIVSQQPRKE